MNEAFLWYLWKYRLFTKELVTTDGEPITVIQPGYQNTDSGPDFFNARLQIGDTLWAGNVEIHIKSGDWIRHGHQDDRAFDNVILHVVFEADRIIRRPNGQVIPVVAVKNNFELSKWTNYQQLTRSKGWIPCEKQINEIDKLIIQQWLDRLLVDRLEAKTSAINVMLSESNGDWQETFYRLLARNFGFKVNAIPFELLAKSLPMKILSRLKNNLFQLEALLLGQAGLLSPDFVDLYPKQLYAEYIYMQNKLLIQPLEGHLWKFGRLRPSNFPTIRLMQFAALIHKSEHLFSKIIKASSMEELHQLFTISASEYWNTHFQPDRPSGFQIKSLGASAIDNILINTIVPFLFSYGKSEGHPALLEKAILWMEDCCAEQNAIIRGWKKVGVVARSAAHSQALIELKNTYCLSKKCLTCGIGISLLTK